jgi:hypothetical protein
MTADFYSLEMGSSNYLHLFTLNGLARSNCFAHTVGAKKNLESSAPTVPIEREKGKGEGGELEEPVRKYCPHHSPSQPTIAAQLLGKPASGDPYTILIMGHLSFTSTP